MQTHQLVMLGASGTEVRIAAATLQEALAALLEGARLATRFAVEGASVRKGPRPTWLDAACDVVVTGLLPGSTVIRLEAPALGTIDPSRFGGDMLATHTAIDVFATTLAALTEGPPEQVVADGPLLDSCARFARLGAFAGVRLEGLTGRQTPVTIAHDTAAQIARVRESTPPPQAVRVAGVLDTVSASRPDVVLRLAEGVRVPARMAEHDVTALRGLLGTDVVVSGVAQFLPSGRLLVVDVEHLAPARKEDQLFAVAPTAKRRKLVQEPLAPPEKGGVAAFFGTWPGDEGDADWAAALRVDA